MMKTYQMMGVDQSAARYTTTRHNRRHTCEELGICQPIFAVGKLRKLPLAVLDEDEPSQRLLRFAQKDIHLGAGGGWPGGGFDSRFCGHQNAPDSGDLRDLRTRWGNFSSIRVRPMVS